MWGGRGNLRLRCEETSSSSAFKLWSAVSTPQHLVKNVEGSLSRCGWLQALHFKLTTGFEARSSWNTRSRVFKDSPCAWVPGLWGFRTRKRLPLPVLLSSKTSEASGFSKRAKPMGGPETVPSWGCFSWGWEEGLLHYRGLLCVLGEFAPSGEVT